jgi:hypothetical protein
MEEFVMYSLKDEARDEMLLQQDECLHIAQGSDKPTSEVSRKMD